MSQSLELGIDTFGDVTFGPDGQLLPQARVLRDVVDEAVLADQVGIDAFGVGEHHRADFAVSAPEVVLAAIAGKTSRIVLGSAVTVLSTDDPVRVFQRFSTLNAVSNGRAEVILGRGSFTESYPLFGYDLSRYEELFEEKLALFAELVKSQPVTWSGTDAVAADEPDRVSADRDGHAAHVGWRRRKPGVGRSRGALRLSADARDHRWQPARFLPFATISIARRSSSTASRRCRLRVHSPGHVAATDEQAKEDVWPHYEAMMNRIGAERGWSPTSRAHFEREAGPDGALCVGSPETVAAKIAKTVKQLGALALRHEIQQRHAAARQAHDEHRALRHEGHAEGEGAGWLGDRALFHSLRPQGDRAQPSSWMCSVPLEAVSVEKGSVP